MDKPQATPTLVTNQSHGRVQLLNFIGAEEGLRLKAYKCSQGFWTIGYGHNLQAHGYSPSEASRMAWTQAQAEAALAADVDNALSSLLARWPWAGSLAPARLAVLVSMAFQMGIDGLAKFKRTIKAIEGGLYVVAAENMLESLWAKQTPARAVRAAHMMASGEFPEEVNGVRIS